MMAAMSKIKSFLKWLCPWFFDIKEPKPNAVWGIAYKDGNGDWVYRTTEDGRIITTYEKCQKPNAN